MATDFGLAVSPDFRDSTLYTVSPRAIKLWLLLASHATHAPLIKDVAGHRVQLGTGEWLASWRVLQRLLGCGKSQLGKALAELKNIDAIDVIPVYATVPNQDRQRSQIGNTQRSGNGTDRHCLISRLKVHGMKSVPRIANGPNLGTKRSMATSSPSWQERQQNAKALQVLEAEGR